VVQVPDTVSTEVRIPIYDCQIESKHPTIPLNKDQAYPIPLSNARCLLINYLTMTVGPQSAVVACPEPSTANAVNRNLVPIVASRMRTEPPSVEMPSPSQSRRCSAEFQHFKPAGHGDAWLVIQVAGREKRAAFGERLAQLHKCSLRCFAALQRAAQRRRLCADGLRHQPCPTRPLTSLLAGKPASKTDG
jgi:hypothetical protein